MGLDPSFAEALLIEAREYVHRCYDHEQGPALALVPYGLRPGHKFADVELDRLAWLVGRPGRTTGQRVGDLSAGDQLLFYPSSRLHLNLFVG
ncbi:MAG: hypothetical protein HC898_04590, partial [Phycisphaerales bacterium]|nr:hypothetical protein [Phycisphaerales bacterium]